MVIGGMYDRPGFLDGYLGQLFGTVPLELSTHRRLPVVKAELTVVCQSSEVDTELCDVSPAPLVKTTC